MICRVLMAALILAVHSPAFAEHDRPVVKTLRVPNGGIQPQLAIGKDDAVHMLYYKGEASAGDIFYVMSTDSGQIVFKTDARQLSTRECYRPPGAFGVPI